MNPNTAYHPLAPEQRVEMIERNVERLARNPHGFQFTDTFFMYTSHMIGPYYLESVAVENNGEDYQGSCNDLISIVGPNLSLDGSDVIAGGESRDWDFSNVVAYGLKLPHMKIYKDGSVKGCLGVEGKNVIMVSDLNNEGSSFERLWLPTIKKKGGQVTRAFYYVDRLEYGVEVLQRWGVSSDAVLPLNQHAWDHARSIGVNGLTLEAYRNCMARLDDREGWAESMLRSEAGTETLADYLNSPKQRKRAQGVITQGYPHLKEELIDRLKQSGKLEDFSFLPS